MKSQLSQFEESLVCRREDAQTRATSQTVTW